MTNLNRGETMSCLVLANNGMKNTIWGITCEQSSCPRIKDGCICTLRHLCLVLFLLFRSCAIWRDLHRPLDVLTHVDQSQMP